jgi:hypothetical protein
MIHIHKNIYVGCIRTYTQIINARTHTHTHTNILWRICSRQELWSQRNNRCYVTPARDNRGIVTIRDVTRTAVAVERLGNHVSAGTSSRNNVSAVFSVRSLSRGYKKDKEYHVNQSSSVVPSEQLV